MDIQKYYNKLKELKGYSVLIIPEDTAREPKTHRFSIMKIYIIIAVYTLIAMLAGFLFMNITPLGLMLYPKYANLNSSDLEKVEELNSRMYFLTKELEKLKSTNERLKYAMILGDTLLFDSLSKKQTETEKSKLPAGGSLLFLINYLFQQESLYFYPPAEGFVSRSFDPEKGHMGTDYVLKTGSPIYSSANGYVIFAGFTTNDGYMIIVSHPQEFVSVYKHCSVLLKKNRDRVTQGEIVALSGNSGKITTGPHLHFEIWKDGLPVNPEKYLLKF